VKIFSILQPALVKTHPQEDYFVMSKKYPIFVVADGVSLNFDNKKDYPKHSGAGEAAKIFCETVLAEAEKKFENFEEKDLKEIFEVGSKAVLEYNDSRGRTKDTINYFDIDLFSATTSFLLIKNLPRGKAGNKAFWWSLCDAGVILCDKEGKQKFISPNGWINFPKDWNEKRSDKEKIIIRHRDYRNAVGVNGKLTGYGVVDGEKSAKLYLNTGAMEINAGDLIFVYTDGFENYFELPGFIDIFKSWPASLRDEPEDLQSRLEALILEKSKTEPKKYGAEKTLLAISI
jgi:serine/threonine protein phosphatase PrpC